MKMAYNWVVIAEWRYQESSSQRRDFVVAMLMKRGIPESVARLAVELAVFLYKQKTAGHHDHQ